MPGPKRWYAVCRRDGGAWLEDTCAGGKWSYEPARAKWWPSAGEAWAELEACDIDGAELECVEVVPSTFS